ncbi:acid-activated periplasmic chaperone HdeA [Microbulbifer hainanensis]|uniref:acid-activated periplasmic chaperone HdeA n=1 Tax=Microbulbifer hainanensis TaxID=2735675 RepID=UPI0029BFEC33|nr:acid-activated periplasmic chaperone HdeA [Microbulbifer hainanensis]
MKSKLVILPLVIAAGITSFSAVAETKKHLKDWTCEDFLAIDDQYKPKVVYWASAYSKKGKPEDGMLDIEGTEKVTPMIIEACGKAPKESFGKKLKGEWHKLEKGTKGEMEKMKDKM